MLNITKYQSKIIKIDSSKATSYANSEKTKFTYTFDQIAVDNEHSILFSLSSFVCPYSFYGCNKHNQYFDYTEIHEGQETVKQKIIVAGNYSAVQFANVLKNMLNENNNPVQYNVEYNLILNRFKFFITSPNSSCTFNFLTGENNNESCYSLFGFDKADVTFTDTQPLLSTMVVSMNDIYYLQLKTDLVNTLVVDSEGNDSIMQVIPINCQPNGFISLQADQFSRFMIYSKCLSSIEVELLDNYGRSINLNGRPFYFTIKLDFIENEKHGIPNGVDPRQIANSNEYIPDDELTPLQYMYKYNITGNAPRQVEPVNMKDFIEYQQIQEMLKKLERKKKNKNKNKNK